jgi:hypothetical protein
MIKKNIEEVLGEPISELGYSETLLKMDREGRLTMRVVIKILVAILNYMERGEKK